MRGTSSGWRRHGAALLLLVGLAALWTWVSWGQGAEELAGDTQNILLMVLKQVHPDLFQRDGVFFEAEKFHFYTPLARHYLAWTYRATGDLLWGVKVLVFPLNLLFLGGAYLLFWRLYRHCGLAVLLAVLASLPLFVKLAEETYGIGPLKYMYPRTVFTAFLPWLVLGYLANLSRRVRLLGLFAAIGVLANVHPPSGLLLVEVLAVALIMVHRGSRWSVVTAILGGLAAIPGVLPSAWAYFGAGVPVEAGALGYGEFYALVRGYFRHYFYPPQNLTTLPAGVIHGLTAILTGLGLYTWWRPQAWGGRLLRLTAVGCLAYILSFDREMYYYLIFLAFYAVFLTSPREYTRQLEPVFFLVVAIFWVAILGMLALHGVAWLFQIQPDLNQARAVRLAPLLLFALFGEGLVNLTWMRPAWNPKKVVGVALAGLALFMNLRWNYRTLIQARPNPDQAALVELAAWARNETPRQALFLFDSLTFRLLSQRALTGCYKDRGVTFASGRGFAAWQQHYRELQAAQQGAGQLMGLAARKGADFVVLPAAVPGAPGEKVVFRNQRYRVVQVEPEG